MQSSGHRGTLDYLHAANFLLYETLGLDIFSRIIHRPAMVNHPRKISTKFYRAFSKFNSKHNRGPAIINKQLCLHNWV